MNKGDDQTVRRQNADLSACLLLASTRFHVAFCPYVTFIDLMKSQCQPQHEKT